MGGAVLLTLLAGLVVAGCGGGGGGGESASGVADVCDPDDGGLTLPDGFCATVVADSLGQPRHLTVADNGDVYVALREMMNGGGVAALRDTDGDYKADQTEFFAESGATGIGLHDGSLYFAPDTSIWRYERAGGELVPSGDRETIVTDFPAQDQHAVKPFDIDDNGNLYVNVGAPSNACMEQTRTKGSPGQDPCPLLEEHAGIWRYSATETGQTHTPDARYASGIRNAVALTWNDAQGNLYAAQHGRDQLHSFFPDLYTQAESAELPAEEFFEVNEGDDFGWPYCYYNWMTGQKLLGPEYGGDRETVGRCEQFEAPIQAFPGHWAPNDVLFYDGDQFPEEYRGGAFIAWHGSWNRAPLPQEGFKVTYTPFENGSPAGNFEVFADDFAGVPNPGNAEHRPTGLAVGPDGGLYVADDEGGTVWRIAYVGTENN